VYNFQNIAHSQNNKLLLIHNPWSYMMKTVGIWGSRGFAGKELIKILSIKAGVKLIEFPKEKECKETLKEIDYAILALPAEESLKLVPEILSSGITVVDLSGAYRLKDLEVFKKYYGMDHPHPELLGCAVYGLPEMNYDAIKKAELIANPGCYATAIELALLPLALNSLIDKNAAITIKAVSGYTGAGKQAVIPKRISPYKPGRKHQHIPEIEEVLNLPGLIEFYPHIAPWPRGIEAMIRLKTSGVSDIEKVYEDYYHPNKNHASYIRISDHAKKEDVIGTNDCIISIRQQQNGVLMIDVAIDNLIKGAAGQAVQNLILMDPDSFGNTVF
jgi:N-acetyl-gamma-glutamyl-phosphate reductase